MKKNSFIILVLFGFICHTELWAGCNDSNPSMIIKPAHHPNACVALELRNLPGHTGNRNWEFDPAFGVPIDADTGLPLTPNPYPLPQGATKIVYWTAAGDKRFRYNAGSYQRFHNCNCNPIAADYFEDAPLICNTELYCGTTASAYGVDQASGDLQCNGEPDHSGSLENNSWLRFIAAASTANFNINVLSNCKIQFAVYEYNPPPASSANRFILKTDYSWTTIDDGFTGVHTIVATGLIPGNEYYLHFDGHGGAVCNYQIGFNSGILTAGVTASSTLICPGDPITLTGSPNVAGATYTWTDNHGGTYPDSYQIVVNPTVGTTYSLNVGLTGCQNIAQAIPIVIDDCSLPVTLTNFHTECIDAGTKIKWQTNVELNNDYFVIEKAGDDLVFKEFKIIDGEGNSTSVINYSIVDSERFPGGSYYRIRQIDYDGSETYSEIISSKDCLTEDFTVTNMGYNSLTNEIVVGYMARKETSVTLQLIDIRGQIVFSGMQLLDSNTNQLRIPLTKHIANSMYIMNLSTDDFSKVQRIYVGN